MVGRQFQEHVNRQINQEKPIVKREPPPIDWLDCCTYVSIGTELSYGTAVFRDSKNQIHAIIATRFNVTDLLLTEGQIMLSAVERAVKCKLTKVIFYSDNADVECNFRDNLREESHHMLEGLVERLRILALPLQGLRVRKINRLQIFIAHNAAKWARHHFVEGEIDLDSIEAWVLLYEVELFPGMG